MTSFTIAHKLFVGMLEKGAFATTSPRAIESAVNGVRLLRLSVGDNRLSMAAMSPDIATAVFEQVEGVSGDRGGVCINAAEIAKDLASLTKSHTLKIEWSGHGKVTLPAGKVVVTVYNEKQRPIQTWEYDAYDPANVPAMAPPKEFLVSFNALEFRRCIDAISFAAGITVTGLEDNIMLRVANNQVQMAATDTGQMGIVTPEDGTYKIGTAQCDFVLISAKMLDKWTKMLGPNDEVKILVEPDKGHAWALCHTFVARFTMPAPEIRSTFPAMAVERIANMTTGLTIVIPDKEDMMEAVAAALARDARYFEMNVAGNHVEVEITHYRSTKPALVACDSIVDGLKNPMRISSMGVAKALEKIQGEKVCFGFNPEETRTVLRGENPRLKFVFQRAKQLDTIKV